MYSLLAENLGMEGGNINERRMSTAVHPLWLEPNQSSGPSRDLSPIGRPNELADEELTSKKMNIHTHVATTPKIQIPAITRYRAANDTPNFENTEVEELIAMLRETENLEEQGDILQYLVDTQGLDFNTGKFLYIFNLSHY